MLYRSLSKHIKDQSWFAVVRVSIILLLIFLLIPTATAKNDDEIITEVQNFYAGYVKAFTSQQAQELADNYIIAPVYIQNVDENSLLETKQEVVDYFSNEFSDLSKANYEKSEMLANNFCILSPTTAVVSIAFRRFDSDGKVILQSGATYSLIKHDERWRFTMLSIHPVERVISCENRPG